MEFRARESSFEEVYPLWCEGLWPGRQSAIKPVSPIGLDLRYSEGIANAQPHFWAVEQKNGKVAGVLSGYETGGGYFRVRGLYVTPQERRLGISTLLLAQAQEEALSRHLSYLWTLPRQPAWPAYQAFGFIQRSPWFTEGMEFGPNCLAVRETLPA